MSSTVDICNLALSHLGDAATVSSIDPPEGSSQAEHCARFYPIARDALLEMHPWNFATKRTTLAEVSDAAPDTWSYAYGTPNNCLRVLNIYPSEATSDDEGQDFTTETDGTRTLIFTNTEVAVARYILRITDTARYTPMFVTALSYLLASYLAGPVLKGETGIKVGQAMYKWFLTEFGKAAAASANATKFQPEHTPGFMAARS